MGGLLDRSHRRYDQLRKSPGERRIVKPVSRSLGLCHVADVGRRQIEELRRTTPGGSTSTVVWRGSTSDTGGGAGQLDACELRSDNLRSQLCKEPARNIAGESDMSTTRSDRGSIHLSSGCRGSHPAAPSSILHLQGNDPESEERTNGSRSTGHGRLFVGSDTKELPR
jgi:hypothetical protein